jgi:hypothetical protein
MYPAADPEGAYNRAGEHWRGADSDKHTNPEQFKQREKGYIGNLTHVSVSVCLIVNDSANQDPFRRPSSWSCK